MFLKASQQDLCVKGANVSIHRYHYGQFHVDSIGSQQNNQLTPCSRQVNLRHKGQKNK